jgi:hypothetical protein
VKRNIKTGFAVMSVVPEESVNQINCFQTASNQWVRIDAKQVIIATPRFIAERLLPSSASNSSGKRSAHDLRYSPWLVANITVTNVPAAQGVELSWDNVNYRGESLGYVNANHQQMTTREGWKVLTFYYPLSELPPAQARQKLLGTTTDVWSQKIIGELESMHPGITSCIVSINLWPWGHGMISPSVGFIWGEQRKAMKQRRGSILFAHSDMSGMSNFEEAQYHGISAAQQILQEPVKT